jgi:hypothetical protein
VFDELSAADEALALGTSELPAGADILASRLTARHSRDKDDLRGRRTGCTRPWGLLRCSHAARWWPVRGSV